MKAPEDFHASAQRAVQLLKSLANEDRLTILCALAEGEKNVGEIEEMLGIRQPTLSQQLSHLRSAGLVSTRRDSKRIYYSLASEEAEEVIGLLYKIYCAGPATGAEPEDTAGAKVPEPAPV